MVYWLSQLTLMLKVPGLIPGGNFFFFFFENLSKLLMHAQTLKYIAIINQVPYVFFAMFQKKSVVICNHYVPIMMSHCFDLNLPTG